jgi:hypothetical protein
MSRIYQALLRLYPADCAAWCGPEMLAAFENAIEERGPHTIFALTEWFGLVTGAARAWRDKLTSSRYMRGFWAPSRMRQPGQTPEDWFPAGARVLADVIEAQRRRG